MALYIYIYIYIYILPAIAHVVFLPPSCCVIGGPAVKQITSFYMSTLGQHNSVSMMDLTRRHFYLQGERQCALDMFN